jgi:uncharacterized repeat protein (TIGR03803 family)
VNKQIRVGFPAARVLRLVIPVLLLVLAGRAFNAEAQTETNLYSFGGSPNDGLFPYAGLVQGSDGNFYGTTQQGGASGNGAVFRISPSGTYTTLYSFVGYPGDGEWPYAGLVQGSDGNFYGTTEMGGTNSKGTVFRISPSGSETILYSFPGFPNDGTAPVAGLVQGSDGNFYGTTEMGGTNNVADGGDGTVFRISPSGTYTNLYSFGSHSNDGIEYAYSAGLVQGSDGNFYGATSLGGGNSLSGRCPDGCGTVFRITPSGSETVLYSFGNSPPFAFYPQAGLVLGSDGNLYGTTEYAIMGAGTVFRISLSGSYTSLYSFAGSPAGAWPLAGLVQGSDGNFYGTTSAGGTSANCGHGCGTVFRISPSGAYTSLYSFGSYPGDGGGLWAGLVQGSDGNFYGTTEYGGTYGYGTVFKVTVPLNPPANQISAVQITGNDVAFSIPSVAYETYQLQFTTDLASGIWSNVPGVSVTNSIGALLTLTNTGGAVGPQGFYRFVITP